MAKRAPNSEAELLGRARDGDVDAFESLYRTHVGQVFALCLRLCADRGRAEDVTQEVFVRAWQRLDSFRGDSRLSTWLHRLAVNAALSALRSEGRRLSRTEELGEQEPVAPQTAAHPAAALDLERGIAALPDQARLVFVLHDVEGWTHREIAARIGLAEGTSKAHLHRARQLLRKALRS